MKKIHSKSQMQKDAHWRENYEDHSLKFLDWAQHLGLEKTRFGKWYFLLDEKFNFKRVSFILLFSLVLAFTLNFEIKTSLDLKSGDVAQYDIVSPLSFEMVDEVTTEEKRIRAEMAVPVVFDFDPQVFEKVSGSIYKSFRVMRLKVRSTVWPKSLFDREEKQKEFFIHKGEFEKNLGVEVPDYLFEWLVENKFSARIENAIIRNLEKWYQSKIAENPGRSIPSQNQVVVARAIQKNSAGREFVLRREEILDSLNVEDFILVNTQGLDKMSSKDQQNMLAFARHLLYPNLTLNKQEISERKQAARSGVLPITMTVKKNQTIVAKNNVVQPSQVALLKEIQVLKSDRRHSITMLAMALCFVAIIVIFFQYLRRFSSRIRLEDKDILVMGLVCLTVLIITKLFLFTTETAFFSRFGSLLPAGLFLFAAPIAAGPMLVGLVISSGEVVWLFSAFLALTVGMMTELNFPIMLITFVGGVAAARGVFSCKKRNDIYWAGLRTGLVNAVMIALMVTIMQIGQENYLKELLFSIPAGFFSGIFSSLIAMMLIPFIESAFNYTTDIKLLELSNLNHPLMKEMIVKAPGTYHHSLMVGSMVEAAAEAIGANSLLGKVMCYYHDIGKIGHANYFIENQKPGINPHDHISPYLSKTLLVAHVKDGVELGMQYKLGKPIIDGIIQHHGTTLISYFYNKAIDVREEGDAEIQEEEFRYPGPKPQFKEAALCMLADSIEAASRSLDEPTPVRLQNIVRNIIQRKFIEGQLDECNLTLKDLSKVESAFIRILLGIYHQRIDYPKNAGGNASENPEQHLFVAQSESKE